MTKKGRKTKLDKWIQDEICKALRSGNYVETVCDYVGISKPTYYGWMKKGREATERLEENPRAKVRKDEQPFIDFFNAVKKALAQSEMRDIALIGKAAESNWQAAAWRLERKFPKKWGRKEQVSAEVKTEHSGEVVNKDEKHISITHKIDEYSDVYAKIAERGAIKSIDEGNDS